MSIILTGYKFKPTHYDIHFLVLGGDAEGIKFTRDKDEATRFSSQTQATRAIYNRIAEWRADDDYEWTPVLTDEDGNEVGNIRPSFKVGTPQFKEQDLPYFLNLKDSNKAVRTGEFEKALINDPSTSHWLKEQLVKTAERDPVDALNDAEALVSALRTRLKLFAEA